MRLTKSEIKASSFLVSAISTPFFTSTFLVWLNEYPPEISMISAPMILVFTICSSTTKSSSISIGLITYLSMPTSIAFSNLSFSLYALRMITGVFFETSFICFDISRPSMIGIIMSAITISGLNFLNFLSPSSPFEADMTF